MIVNVLSERGRRTGEQWDFSRVTKCKEEPKRAEGYNSWKKKKKREKGSVVDQMIQRNRSARWKSPKLNRKREKVIERSTV